MENDVCCCAGWVAERTWGGGGGLSNSATWDTIAFFSHFWAARTRWAQGGSVQTEMEDSNLHASIQLKLPQWHQARRTWALLHRLWQLDRQKAQEKTLVLKSVGKLQTGGTTILFDIELRFETNDARNWTTGTWRNFGSKETSLLYHLPESIRFFYVYNLFLYSSDKRDKTVQQFKFALFITIEGAFKFQTSIQIKRCATCVHSHRAHTGLVIFILRDPETVVPCR